MVRSSSTTRNRVSRAGFKVGSSRAELPLAARSPSAYFIRNGPWLPAAGPAASTPASRHVAPAKLVTIARIATPLSVTKTTHAIGRSAPAVSSSRRRQRPRYRPMPLIIAGDTERRKCPAPKGPGSIAQGERGGEAAKRCPGAVLATNHFDPEGVARIRVEPIQGSRADWNRQPRAYGAGAVNQRGQSHFRADASRPCPKIGTVPHPASADEL